MPPAIAGRHAMMALVLLTHVAVPLALLAWLFLLPVGSLAGLVLQVELRAPARSCSHLHASRNGLCRSGGCLGSTALWLSALLAVSLRRGADGLPMMPDASAAWAGIALSAVLFGLGGWYSAKALTGKGLPPVEVVDIANPFGPGRYLVGHGGSTPLVNGHMRTLDLSVERFRPWHGQSYAVNFFGLGRWGLRARGWRAADRGRAARTPDRRSVSGAGGSFVRGADLIGAVRKTRSGRQGSERLATGPAQTVSMSSGPTPKTRPRGPLN